MTTPYNRCSVDDCDARAHSKGYCSMHYARLKRTGNTELQPRKHAYPDGCSVDGCDRPHHSKGYCDRHYARQYRTGTAGTAEKLPRGYPPVFPHGTPQARRRHYKAGEPLCEACSVTMPLTPAQLEKNRAYRRRKAEELWAAKLETERAKAAEELEKERRVKAGRPLGSTGVQSAGYGTFDLLDELTPDLAAYIKARRARMARRARLHAVTAATRQRSDVS